MHVSNDKIRYTFKSHDQGLITNENIVTHTYKFHVEISFTKSKLFPLGFTF